MPNSPTNPTSPAQNDTNSNTQKRICDFCGELEAVLYCRADSAKLCLSCDREVHSTNQLFTKHTRFQLCDSCDSSPATIFCCTEHSVLCQNCDYELHNQPRSSGNHDRRPLEGFTGRPSVSEIAAAVGFEGFDCKSLLIEDEVTDQGFGGGGGLLGGFEEEDDGFCEFFVWDTPASMVNLDDLIVTTDKSHNFHAMGVPTLPKDRNLSCGQHKHEILRQLRELAKLEPTIKEGSDPLIDYHFEADENQDFKVQCQVPAYKHEEHSIFLGNEARAYNWGNDEIEAVHDVFLSPSSQSHIEESFLNTETKSGISSTGNLATTGQTSQFPVGSDSVSFAPKVPLHEFTPADRDSALSRYKEKKRTRRFEKHIRYESRKVQAENRTRIRGRFAKIDNRVV